MDGEFGEIRGALRAGGSVIGVGDLLVEAFDARPQVGTTTDGPARHRLGSTVSDAAGHFTLRYPVSEAGFSNSSAEPARPWIVLVVRTAESGSAGAGGSTVLYETPPRKDAARIEHFVIALDPTELDTAATIGSGGATTAIADVRASQLRAALAGQTTLRDAARVETAKLFAAQAEISRGARRAATDLAQSLSKVPAAARTQPGYIAPGSSITAGIARVTAARNGQFPGIRKALSVPVPAETLEALQSEHPDGIPLPAMVDLIAGASGTGVLDTIAEHPAAIACRDEVLADHPCITALADASTADDEDEDDEPGGESGDDDEVPGDDPSPTGLDAVKARVDDLVEAVTLPDQPLSVFVPERPDADAVMAGASAMQLTGGPADVAAFHDFHSLQIAFDHVWREVFDSRVLRVAERLYTLSTAAGAAIENDPELGGDVSLDNSTSTQSRLERLRAGANDLLSVYAQTPSLEQTASPGRSVGGGDDVGVVYLKSRDDWYTGGEDTELPGIDPDPDPPADPPWTDPGAGDQHTPPISPTREVRNLLAELESLLREAYAFTVFAADGAERAVNFGLVCTWRQRWDPLSYQTGRIVDTLPLAPGEERKVTMRSSVTRKRAEKETRRSLRSTSGESSATSRAEADILRKAESKTNFALSSSGTIDIGIADAKTTAAFGRDAAKLSQETRKDFREAVIKAAQEVQRERTLEVSTEATFESEQTSTATLTNPNDELAMTCVFFELQRRYRVSERLHRLTPVVLVAQEVPDPSGVDAAFLIQHDWVIERVLLDDSFRPALRYLSTRFLGDKQSLAHLRATVTTQQDLVETLKSELKPLATQIDRRLRALQDLIKQRAAATAGDSGGLLDTIGEFVPGVDLAGEILGFFGGGDDDHQDEIDAARILEQAARDTLERVERQHRDLELRLETASSALQQATDTFVAAYREHLNQKVQIARLRLHVKANILYYMQAIWAHEPPDQRYFRLHQTQVPRIDGSVLLSPTGEAPPRAPRWDLTATEFEAVYSPSGGDEQFDPLSEVADLDNLLGFKGNYMIFPLREPNALVDYMMLPYLDAHSVLRDPDDLAGWTLEQFADYVCCLRRQVDNGDLSEEAFDSFKPGLQSLLKRLLTDPRPASDEVTVPSGSLYLEILPGAHPLLEDFKLMHRAMDVKNVQAQNRRAELDNLRRAARVLEGNYEDPDIDDIEKRLVVGASVVDQ